MTAVDPSDPLINSPSRGAAIILTSQENAAPFRLFPVPLEEGAGSGPGTELLVRCYFFI